MSAETTTGLGQQDLESIHAVPGESPQTVLKKTKLEGWGALMPSPPGHVPGKDGEATGSITNKTAVNFWFGVLTSGGRGIDFEGRLPQQRRAEAARAVLWLDSFATVEEKNILRDSAKYDQHDAILKELNALVRDRFIIAFQHANKDIPTKLRHPDKKVLVSAIHENEKKLGCALDVSEFPTFRKIRQQAKDAKLQEELQSFQEQEASIFGVGGSSESGPAKSSSSTGSWLPFFGK